MNSIGQTVFELESINENVDGQMDGQTNGQKRTNEQTDYTNFKSNLVMMVIYVPVKFEFDWANCFRVRVQKRKCGRTDGWTDKRTKKGQTKGRNYTNFERKLAIMVIYLPVKFEFDWSQSGDKKCGRTDGRRTHQSNRRVGYTQPA